MLMLLFLLILVITNFFGMFNALEAYRIPGIGKPSDFLLILLNIMVLAKVLFNKKILTIPEKSIIKLNLIVLSYIVFLIFYSSFFTGRESFNYALRVGGIYLYYSAFLFPIFLITKQKDFFNFINFLRIGGIITGSLAIISNILGYSVAHGVVSGGYGNFIRVYLPEFFNYFVIVFWTIQFITKERRIIKIHYVELFISILGIILFVGRTRMIVLVLMILGSMYFLSKQSKNRKKILLYFIIFGIGMFFILNIFQIDAAIILQRFQDGYIETQQGTGNLSLRFYAIGLGYEIFSTMPFFGTGFIHSNSNFFSNLVTTDFGSAYATTNNTDFGLASILFTTGIIGFSLITMFIISFLFIIKNELTKMMTYYKINIQIIFGLTILTMVLFEYFVEQVSGNTFGNRSMTTYLIAMGFAISQISRKNLWAQKNGEK
jgi:O-Antigen ligase